MRTLGTAQTLAELIALAKKSPGGLCYGSAGSGSLEHLCGVMLPSVPSISEVVPGYEMFGWYSIVAPTGTPPAILSKVSLELAKLMKEPEFGEQLKGLGIDIVGGTREELDAFRRAQTKQISALAKTFGVDVK
jgi:tripartite-type tricarboxylate transporter receptor subunit TctC